MKQEIRTLTDWHQTLAKRFEGAPREASRFYSLQMLPRLIHRLDNEKTDCTTCKEHFNKLDNITLHMAEWFKNEGNELKEYQKLIESIIKHLHTNHAIVAKGLWLSRIVVIGLFVGVIIAYLANILYPGTEKSGLLTLGAVLGMMLGWITGKIYENQLKKRGQIF